VQFSYDTSRVQRNTRDGSSSGSANGCKRKLEKFAVRRILFAQAGP